MRNRAICILGGNKMDAAKKVRMLMANHNLTASKLSEIAGFTQSNFSKKLKTNSFSLEDLDKIAAAVDAKFEFFFFLEDGSKI